MNQNIHLASQNSAKVGPFTIVDKTTHRLVTSWFLTYIIITSTNTDLDRTKDTFKGHNMTIKVSLRISICCYKIIVDCEDFVAYQTFAIRRVEQSLIQDYYLILQRIAQLLFIPGNTRSTCTRRFNQICNLVNALEPGFFYSVAVKTAMLFANGVGISFHNARVHLN